jgi:hypothetical protein
MFCGGGLGMKLETWQSIFSYIHFHIPNVILFTVFTYKPYKFFENYYVSQLFGLPIIEI